MALTSRESQLVKDGWEVVLMPKYEYRAMEFFLNMFAKEPSLMERFSFVKDVPASEKLENNARLQKHANIALLLVGDAVASFGDEDTAKQVKARLRLLGRLHVKFHTDESNFQVVKDAFMDMLVGAFRSLWDKEYEVAWRKAIEIVCEEMIAGLRQGHA